jgi:hypothetical protein
MKRYTPLFFLLLILFIMSGCASPEPIDPCLEGKTYGFLWGILHGLIAPIALIVSFFDSDTVMFAQNNTGSWYGLGFLIGSGGWGILASKSKKDK